jgi:hypothetical protein
MCSILHTGSATCLDAAPGVSQSMWRGMAGMAVQSTVLHFARVRVCLARMGAGFPPCTDTSKIQGIVNCGAKMKVTLSDSRIPFISRTIVFVGVGTPTFPATRSMPWSGGWLHPKCRVQTFPAHACGFGSKGRWEGGAWLCPLLCAYARLPCAHSCFLSA